MPAGPAGPANQPDRPGRGRALTRVRHGLRIAGIPVTAVVALELVAAALLLTPDVSVLDEIVVLAVAVLIAVSVVVPLRGVRLGAWVAGLVAYAGRRHVFTAHEQPPPPLVRRVADLRNVENASATDDEDLAPVTVPADVLAFFPGMTVLRSRSRSSAEIGLVQWQGRWLAVIELRAPETDLLSTTEARPVPVDRFLQSLAGKGFGLDAVQIMTQSLFGTISRHGEGALSRVAAELGQVAPLVRGRGMWVTVRLDPVSAATAIEMRGGGFVGLGRLAAAAASRIESEAKAAGLIARPLEAESVVRAMSAALLQPAAPTDAPARWTESRKSIASAQAHHRCFAVASWHDRTLDAMSVTAGYAVTVTHEVRSIDSEQVSVISVVRLTAGSQSQLDRATRQLRASCRSVGVGLRLLRGQQASALRMTLPAGQR